MERVKSRMEPKVTDPTLRRFCERAIDSPPDNLDDPNAIPYGHIHRVIAHSVFGVAGSGKSTEEQREEARLSAIHQVQRFGPEIVPFLKQELQDILRDEDLAGS